MTLQLAPDVVTGTIAPLGEDVPVSAEEAAYAAASLAPNTRRGYTSDCREFAAWCAARHLQPVPASPGTIADYLTALGQSGATVGTMSRRLAAIRWGHTEEGHPDPTKAARVVKVWKGLRRTHGAPPRQAKAIGDDLLRRTLAAIPDEKTWKTPGRAPEPSLVALRDRALILVGFVGALRRSELAGLNRAQVTNHRRGLELTIGRSKTNQTGERVDHVILPWSDDPRHCPVVALEAWLAASADPDETRPATQVPVFTGITRSNLPSGRPMNPDSINTLVRAAVARVVGEEAARAYSAHSLRAGFVTTANLKGAPDRDIAHQTRHRSMATVGTYIRRETAWTGNAATKLGL